MQCGIMPTLLEVAEADALGGGIDKTNWLDVLEARDWLRKVGYLHARRARGTGFALTRSQWATHLADLEAQWAAYDAGPNADRRVRRNDRVEQVDLEDIAQVISLTEPHYWGAVVAAGRLEADRRALRDIHELVISDERCPPDDFERLDLLREQIEQTDDHLEQLEAVATTLSNRLARTRSLAVIVNAKGGKP